MRRVVGFVASFALATPACQPDGVPAPGAGDASADRDAAPSIEDAPPMGCPASGCAPGECLCVGRCVDYQSDRTNCGGCNVNCPSSAVCIGAVCVDCLAKGRERCGVVCVDTLADPANCGACGHACTDAQRCEWGYCVSICETPQVVCDGRCVNLWGDPANCGACGVRCPPGIGCVAWACTGCPQAWQRACGGACIDVRSDPANCGACGAACGRGATCVAGACVPCGGACAPSERCVDGGCVPCGAGEAVCGDRCVDLARTMEHCGACGRACAPAERCVAGGCVGCAGGTRRCGEACVDVATSPENCGGCGTRCGSTQRCIGGGCADRCDAADPATCPPGTRCVDGFCTGPSAPPRAPLSTTITTSPRPWFRWRLPTGADGAEVEVCADRRCDRAVARWAATGEALRAPVALPPGVYFWRVVARRGEVAVTAPGAVWEFVVRASSAPGVYPPTGLPLLNDLNGDGVADEATVSCVAGGGCGVLVRYGAAPGATPPPDRIIAAPDAPTTSDGWTSLYRLRAPTPLGDVDGDGFGDLAVIVFETRIQGVAVRGQYEYVRIYTGGEAGLREGFSRFGDRSYGVEGLGSMGVYPIGDRNGDGFGDLLWEASGTPSGREYVEYAGPPPLTPAGMADRGGALQLPSHLDVGDFDADGDADVVFVPSTTSSVVNVWARRGPMTYYSCLVGMYFWGGQRWVIRDANDDGFDDLDLRWGSETALLPGGPRGLPTRACPSP